MARSTVAGSLLLAAVLTVAGCSTPDDRPDGPSSAGRQTPEAPDAEPADDTAGTGPDSPADDEPRTEPRADGRDPDHGDATALAAEIIGRDLETAEDVGAEAGWELRVGRVGDERRTLTDDWVVGRATVTLDDDGRTVTEVTAEYDGGPWTFTADDVAGP